MKTSVSLIGDGIENPANAKLLICAAEMFGASSRFRDTKGLADSAEFGSAGVCLPTIRSEELPGLHSRIVALENLPHAKELYGFRPGIDFAVLVGNERRGLSYELSKIATDHVEIPMFSSRINCLNVAAAGAVALYFLYQTPVGAMAVRSDPSARRPEVLLLGAGDHFELGSSIRSAAALGWSRIFIEDRSQVWFGCDRAIRSEGRAAARRGRNEIICIPCQSDSVLGFESVTIITTGQQGSPLHRLNLARGRSQLIVVPDEDRVDVSRENWTRMGKNVEFAHLSIPRACRPMHYRLTATIALAEVSRQVGRRSGAKPPPGPRGPIYDLRLAELAEAGGESIRWEDLAEY